ncbi:hypothetical protein OJ633_001914 [Listeria monocytogenes]|nr:hypothetical protein [Listeria monocytogenes]EKA2557663.1 hypothetical protein [Listeria monocytogenes]EKA2560787.1 hypothetical protein [Listeria monocytogenes]
MLMAFFSFGVLVFCLGFWTGYWAGRFSKQKSTFSGRTEQGAKKTFYKGNIPR